MIRRRLFSVGGLAAAAFFVGGHTPYNQWVIYRKKHLLIGSHKGDPRGYALAKATVAALDRHLPAAKARVARAPHAGRLASLLATDQLETAILTESEAVAMRDGVDGFAPYGRVDLRTLMPVGDRLLVVRADFPQRHAWLVAEALNHTDLARLPDRTSRARPAWHAGSLAFFDGRPLPE